MAALENLKNTKKRKVEEKKRYFQKSWNLDYFFIENPDGRLLCLICKEIVSDNKEYNVKRHHEAKHSGGVYGKLDGDKRELKVKQLRE